MIREKELKEEVLIKIKKVELSKYDPKNAHFWHFGLKRSNFGGVKSYKSLSKAFIACVLLRFRIGNQYRHNLILD